jgi:DNA-binding transcriptional MocR family regulator
LAAHNRTVVVEYDLSAEISYGSPPPAPLTSWDRSGCVVYLREFSRITAAGFRIACLTVEGPLFQRLTESKRRDDFIISTVAQSAFLAYVTSRAFPKGIERARAFYAERRDAALSALQRTMPESVRWITPASGFHVWVSLPPALSARALVHEAALHGVIVAPSDVFSIDGKLDDGIRITFSDNDPEVIERGIERLAGAAHAMLQRGVSSEPARLFEIV